jgi:hypothetical protein
MRRISITIGFAALCAFGVGAAQEAASDEEINPQTIAFVGTKISLEKIEQESLFEEVDPKTGEIVTHMRMDERFDAEYQILDVIEGDYASDKITFAAYDHYGVPKFSTSETVLLFVHDYEGLKVHSKYNFYEVHRTTDGDWAACGNARRQYDPDTDAADKEPLEPITFLNPVQVNIPAGFETLADYVDPNETLSESERAGLQTEIDEDNAKHNNLYRPPIWSRDGDIATCQMGTRVSDLYAFQNETRFKPDQREAICEAENGEAWDAMTLDWRARRKLLNDCTTAMKLANLP